MKSVKKPVYYWGFEYKGVLAGDVFSNKQEAMESAYAVDHKMVKVSIKKYVAKKKVKK